MNLKKILLVALMIISVLAIAGCGEEEKYNTAKKELVQITDTFKTIKATDENKAKFEKEILIQKEPVIKASEKVKIENKKRGNIENNSSNDFIVTSF